MEILCIIPARGGSKGVKLKNIRKLEDKPLIAYTIDAGLESKYGLDVFVSSDHPGILKISNSYGAGIIKRPSDLAEDDSTTIDVLLHALGILDKTYDLIILLQATSPLRTSNHIDEAIQLYMESECDSLISVCEYEHSPYWSYIIQDKILTPIHKDYINKRRQDLPETCRPNGAIYITTPSNLEKYKGFISPKTLAYPMSMEDSVDIDTELDFQICETIINWRKKE